MKFRVIYQNRKYDNPNITFFNDEWFTDFSANSENAQLRIGLPIEDKKGNTIFEGDLIRFPDGYTAKVVWNGISFGLAYDNHYDALDEDWNLENTEIVRW